MLLLLVYNHIFIAYLVAVFLFIRAAWGKSRKDKIAMLVRHKWRTFFMAVLFIPFIMLGGSLWFAYTFDGGMPPGSEQGQLFHRRESKVYHENARRFCMGLSSNSCNMKLRLMERNSYNSEQEYQLAVKQHCEGLSELACDRKLSLSQYNTAAEKSAANSDQKNIKYLASLPLKNELLGISHYLSEAICTGSLVLEELEKLNFRSPGEATDDVNQDYNVFNPNGFIGVNETIEQAAIDEVTTVKESKLFFNIWRTTTDKGVPNDVLYAIIPNIDLAYCPGIEYGAETPERNLPLALPADNSVVFDLGIRKAFMNQQCITMPDNRTYFITALAARFKNDENAFWQTYIQRCLSQEEKSSW